MGKDPVLKKTYVDLLFEECRGMAVFAAERGKPVPVSAARCVTDFETYYADSGDAQRPDISKLSAAHGSLSKVVAPAKPQAILLVSKGSDKGWLDFLGPTPLVRIMIFVAVFSLLTFLYVVQSSYINQDDINIFCSVGEKLVYQLVFLIAASALGSSFAALYKVNTYIRDLTYDPNQAASYWIRFLLGIISGLILSLMIETNAIKSSVLEPNIIRPLLAILGGFSADLFYTVLNRMVETVKSLFEGSNKEILDNRIQALNIKTSQKEIATKVMFSEQLMVLQKKISENSDPEKVKQAIDKLWEGLLPETIPE